MKSLASLVVLKLDSHFKLKIIIIINILYKTLTSVPSRGGKGRGEKKNKKGGSGLAAPERASY